MIVISVKKERTQWVTQKPLEESPFSLVRCENCTLKEYIISGPLKTQ